MSAGLSDGCAAPRTADRHPTFGAVFLRRCEIRPSTTAALRRDGGSMSGPAHLAPVVQTLSVFSGFQLRPSLHTEGYQSALYGNRHLLSLPMPKLQPRKRTDTDVAPFLCLSFVCSEKSKPRPFPSHWPIAFIRHQFLIEDFSKKKNQFQIKRPFK